MTEVLALAPTDHVLEVGTGSGYQTAILAQLAKEVYSIEAIRTLYQTAKLRLEQLGYRNVHLKHGDGRKGWPNAQPFDKIIVTAGTEEIPPALVEQLREGGRLVLPVGQGDQDLILGRKENGALITKPLVAVRFVPMQNKVS
jgi:protein-L-isoaspartate(D-aspartate) O-methyltransferase